MRVFHSIRWRLQLWHAAMLASVLIGFGVTAWRLDRATRFQRVDQELERHEGAIANAIRGVGPDRSGPVRPPRGGPRQDAPRAEDRPEDRRPPPQDLAQRTPPRPPGRESLLEPPRPEGPPPRELPAGGPPVPGDRPAPGVSGTESSPRPLRLPDRDAVLFDGTRRDGFYYVAWDTEGREIARSVSAPPHVPPPGTAEEARQGRLRGTLREYVHVSPQRETILVGRDIGDELSALARLAWLLLAVGGVVFAAGLAGGSWISTRALRPIATISRTAEGIAAGDLSQRIPTGTGESELEDLARVLNETFARLQASFARQIQFTADASHELRTPVTVVLTETQWALSRERNAEEYREALAACERTAQRMRRLIESLLTLARLDSDDDVPHASCRLDQIAGDAIDVLRPVASQRDVTLATSLTPTSCPGDAGQLGQVVTNLVGNAIDYNRAGGTVRIEVAPADGFAVLMVSDTGEGIAPDDLAHVFERFYRADRARSNAADRAGLGLAITKAIVDRHHGTIEASSELGRGTTFTVRLRDHT